MSPPPRVLHFRMSHYSEKVRWALDHKRCGHVRHAQLPGSHVLRARWLTGQQKLPILIIDGTALAGSDRILSEIEERCPDPPLFPNDPEQRERARALAQVFDAEVVPDLRRLFWSAYLAHPAACAYMATDGFSSSVCSIWRACFPVLRPLFVHNMGVQASSVRRARRRLEAHFDRLEAAIGPSGFLVGDGFSVADLTVASAFSAIVRPPEFPYALPEPWPNELFDLRASVAGRVGFRWVLDVYSRHRGSSSEIRSLAAGGSPAEANQ